MGNIFTVHHYLEDRLENLNLNEVQNEQEAINRAFIIFQKIDNGYICPADLYYDNKSYNAYQILNFWRKLNLINDQKYLAIKMLKDNPKPL